jgi:hypothetical protein
VRAKCPCGTILSVPIKRHSTNENFVAVEGRKYSISESFLIALIVSGSIIWCISFICGAVFTMPDHDMIASQIKQIESDTYQATSEIEHFKKLIIEFEKTTQVDTKQKRKIYGIDFSKLYFQLDGTFKQIKEMAAQLKYRMEVDRSWTTDDLLDQFSYESGFSVSKLKEVMVSTIIDGKNINQNWNEFEALLLAGLFLENERHAATKY